MAFEQVKPVKGNRWELMDSQECVCEDDLLTDGEVCVYQSGRHGSMRNLWHAEQGLRDKSRSLNRSLDIC